jgi:hypothetical protein
MSEESIDAVGLSYGVRERPKLFNTSELVVAKSSNAVEWMVS